MPTANISRISQDDALYSQIQRRMVESGEWDRIRQLLNQKLGESGWLDNLKHQSKERAKAMVPLSIHGLLDELAPNTQTSIPLAVRREVMSLVRQQVEIQFEA